MLFKKVNLSQGNFGNRFFFRIFGRVGFLNIFKNNFDLTVFISISVCFFVFVLYCMWCECLFYNIFHSAFSDKNAMTREPDVFISLK